MLVNQKYTTFEIAKIFNIKYGRLREWISGGYVVPSEKADGQGTKSLFSLTDVYMVKLFLYLLERGFSRQEASDRTKNVSSAQYLEPVPDSKVTDSSDRLYNIKLDHYKALLSANYLVAYRTGSRIIMDVLTKKNEKAIIKGIETELLMKYDKDSNGEWDDILLINFKRIREEVDTALLL